MQKFFKQQSAEKKGGEKVASSNEKKIYENMESLEEWAFAGLSQKEMAEMLGMAYSTFRELRKKIPALSALLKNSADFLKAERKKEVEKVEVSLLNRCLGYNADIKKHMKVKKPMQGADGKVLTDANGKVITEEVLEEVTEQQHVPADVGAIKFYLLNKAKDKWKENPDKLELEKKRVANDTKRTKLAEPGGKRNGPQRKDDRGNLGGSGKRWSRCRGMTFYEMRRNTLKPFFASRQRKARLCPFV